MKISGYQNISVIGKLKIWAAPGAALGTLKMQKIKNDKIIKIMKLKNDKVTINSPERG